MKREFALLSASTREQSPFDCCQLHGLADIRRTEKYANKKNAADEDYSFFLDRLIYGVALTARAAFLPDRCVAVENSSTRFLTRVTHRWL